MIDLWIRVDEVNVTTRSVISPSRGKPNSRCRPGLRPRGQGPRARSDPRNPPRPKSFGPIVPSSANRTGTATVSALEISIYVQYRRTDTRLELRSADEAPSYQYRWREQCPATSQAVFWVIVHYRGGSGSVRAKHEIGSQGSSPSRDGATSFSNCLKKRPRLPPVTPAPTKSGG
jgi:hypothetical protein